MREKVKGDCIMKKVWILFLSIFLFFGCDFMLFNKSLDFSFENYTASDIEITEIWADRGNIGDLQDLSFPIVVSKKSSKQIKFVDSHFEFSYSLIFKADGKSYRIPRLSEGTVELYFDEESQKYSAHLRRPVLGCTLDDSYDVIECE